MNDARAMGDDAWRADKPGDWKPDHWFLRRCGFTVSRSIRRFCLQTKGDRNPAGDKTPTARLLHEPGNIEEEKVPGRYSAWKARSLSPVAPLHSEEKPTNPPGSLRVGTGWQRTEERRGTPEPPDTCAGFRRGNRTGLRAALQKHLHVFSIISWRFFPPAFSSFIQTAWRSAFTARGDGGGAVCRGSAPCWPNAGVNVKHRNTGDCLIH